MGMALLLQTSIRSLVYVEALGMSPAAMGISISIVKSLDFLIGFLVGSASDRCTSRWGRRKPFIMIGFPIWVVVMLALFNPPTSLAAERLGNSTLEGDFVTADCLGDDFALASGFKDADVQQQQEQVKARLEACTAAERIPVFNATAEEFPGATAGPSLTIYFTVFYFLFYSVGYSFTTIPYDALGMELTTDYHERTSLFGYKSFSQFFGYLFMGALLMVFAGIHPSSIRKQIFPISIIFAAAVVASFAVMLAAVKEKVPAGAGGGGKGSKVEDKEDKEEKEEQREEDEPLVPSLLPLLYNRPYLNYLCMKVPLSIASLIPVSMLPYILKIVLEDENANGTQGTLTIVVVASAIVACPFTVHAAQRWGKAQVLVGMCLVEAVAMLALAFADLDYFRVMLLAVFVGVGFIGTAIIPDALLADIIDYDELHSGRRQEGAYTVVETNLQQFVEIPAGVLPLLVMTALGYDPNGGCACGCGVECAGPWLRWDCPGDVGYAAGDRKSVV